MFINPENGFVGSSTGLRFFRNVGTPTTLDWEYETTLSMPFGGIDFLDEDNDADFDLFISETVFIDSISFFRNSGTQNEFDFEFETLSYSNIWVGRQPSICFYDIDNDNDEDMILGEHDGGINVYKNEGFVSIEKDGMVPSSGKLSAYPNPFNPVTTILYNLPTKGQFRLSIYDVSGREVCLLVDGYQSPGSFEMTWDGTDHSDKQVAAGMYFARLQAGQYSSVVKMIYLR